MHPNQPDISSDAGSRSELLLTEYTLIPMKAHGRREVMSGGGPLGLLAQEPSDQPFAFLLLSLLSSCYTLCHAVRMTETPQGSLFSFRQASFSTTKRLHQTKWLLSERIWTNLKSPHALAPVSATFICLICFYFKLKRVYQSVVCGYSRCHV